MAENLKHSLEEELLMAKWQKSYNEVERSITEGQVVDNLK